MGQIATKNAQAYIAKMLYEQASSIYIGLGKPTPWTDENKIPDPSPDAISLEEPIAYTKAQRVTLCTLASKEDTDTIAFGDKFYKPVITTSSLNPDATYLYVSTQFKYADIGKEIQFRQVGLFVGFVPNDRVTSTIVLPTQVGTQGTMLSISNNKLINITKTSPTTVGAMYSILPVLS